MGPISLEIAFIYIYICIYINPIDKQLTIDNLLRLFKNGIKGLENHI